MTQKRSLLGDRARNGNWAWTETQLLDQVALAPDTRAAELDSAAHQVGRAVRVGDATVSESTHTLAKLGTIALRIGLPTTATQNIIRRGFYAGITGSPR